ncbi:MAG: NAD(P)/FAD-dependent oxidoreductase [Myxococcota bacterium]|nr:NAD(P)/FAD-dependent oxidoreductase [Myxococcota bacterium]
MAEHVDVLIVGAGISGIDAAYHVQTKLPGKTYAILEARDTLGGTWDLFRYPGIRSDSDMYTLGFPFRPWIGKNAISDGAAILAYVRETAEHYGIDRKIRYRHEVEGARWSSADARWTIDARDASSGQLHTLTCGFLFVCAGYFDYDAGYTPELAGRERFRGLVVHPQHWPADLDVTGQRVVVIGSGATAVTLVPELAKRAAHVTMLQRSPTYILSRPARDPIASWLQRHLPRQAAGTLTRWKNVLLGMAFYEYCRRFPEHAKRLLVRHAEQQLEGAADVATHFTPSYKPWDQRLCLVPDADLFDALKHGAAEVVTDHIAGFTETGLALRSGRTLDADVIVTATGLVLKLFGGIGLEIDGARFDPPRSMLYRGMMCSGVPNFAFSVGYTNASWTLKCDLTSQYVCRLLRYMDEHGHASVRPVRDPSVGETPLIDFSSSYVQRVIDQFPRQGTESPWRLFQNYALDVWLIKHARVDDPALAFTQRPEAARAAVAPPRSA